MERPNNYLGEGAGISPDGNQLVYVGSDNGLHLLNLETHTDHLLLAEAEPGLDVFHDPTFSPDGTQVVFGASGVSYYYAANVYSMRTDGSELRRLIEAQGFKPREAPVTVNAGYARYFYPIQFSPNGSEILLHIYDSVQGTDQVAVAHSDGSQLIIIATGTPLMFGANSQIVYFSSGGRFRSYDIDSRVSQDIGNVSGNILGKLPDKDYFGVDTGQDVDLIIVRDHLGGIVRKLNIPRTISSTLSVAQRASGGMDYLNLTSIQWSNSGRLLLIYESDTAERLEVDASD